MTVRYRDRSNIGNAKVAGMSKDLGLIGLKYNIAAAIFFVGSLILPSCDVSDSQAFRYLIV